MTDKYWDEFKKVYEGTGISEERLKEKFSQEMVYCDTIDVPCPYCSKVGNPVTCPIPKIWYDSDDWGFTCMKCGNAIDSLQFKNGYYCGLKSNI